MVHPFLKRRQGLEPVHYVHPALKPALEETLGVMVFQEQVIRVAMAIANFTPAEADALRRAMSRSRSRKAMNGLRERFLSGALDNDVDETTASTIFDQLLAFSGYGFCKSHAAAFALVAYQTLYLKAHFAAAFYCTLLNHQPMGFYTPDVLVGDARRHGVSILKPDVNRSESKCTLEKSASCRAIRLGLCYVRGLGDTWQTRIVERRGKRPFRDLNDFCLRTRLSRSLVEALIRAGSMDGWGRARRDLLWALGGLIYQKEGLDLAMPVEPVSLPTLGQRGRIAWEYELLGLTTGEHVMRFYRQALRLQSIWSCRELQHRREGENVRTAGLVIVRQRPPSAKGMVFITLEDETGLVNLIVRPRVYERHKAALRNAPVIVVEGQVQRAEHTISLLVHRAVAFLGHLC
jgi:error-prone DNA polymerase